MMAAGQGTVNDSGGAIGAGGLAYFCWLYQVELVALGDEDRHQYRFRRRHDGAEILAWLRTANAPMSLQFQQEYERERRSLEKMRAMFVLNYQRAAGNRPGI